MKYNTSIFILGFMLVSSFLLSCKKYLDAKPNKSLQVPSTVPDLQALLDYGSFLNGRGVSFDEASSDNYYLTTDIYNAFAQENRNTYTWQNNNYSNYPNDWSYIYDIVNAANVVLDHVGHIPVNAQNQANWNNVKGSALFYRAYALLEGAFIFCKAYDSGTAAQDHGMVLRLVPDFNLPSVRSNMKDTYQQIISDTKQAIPLLPDLPQHVMRPSRSAAYVLLARAYLSMRNYDSCMHYANLALQLKSSLLNYNSVTASANRPFKRFNVEVIFYNVIAQPSYANISAFYARVDSILYNSYVNNDLRKAAFFKSEPSGVSFKGTYTSSTSEIYVGLTTDEVYLMRAECYARSGDKDKALQDLNTLLITRWKAGTFVPFTANTANDALNLILMERRKQLLFRNLRWMDIKRLNKEGANIILKRMINGQVYTLNPNENRYALPLPSDIVSMTGMPQNPQ